VHEYLDLEATSSNLHVRPFFIIIISDPIIFILKMVPKFSCFIIATIMKWKKTMQD